MQDLWKWIVENRIKGTFFLKFIYRTVDGSLCYPSVLLERFPYNITSSFIKLGGQIFYKLAIVMSLNNRSTLQITHEITFIYAYNCIKITFNFNEIFRLFVVLCAKSDILCFCGGCGTHPSLLDFFWCINICIIHQKS